MLSETELSFNAKDGWTIHGILSIPDLRLEERSAGVVLIPSPSHDRDVYGHNGYPSVRAAIEKENLATFRIDIRGRGKSAEPTEYHTFTREQRTRVSLDVSAAIEFLSQQDKIDSRLIGVVAEGPSAEAAVVAAVEDPRVYALVLLSGRMGQAAKSLIASRKDLPVLCVVSQEDRISFVDMIDVYKLSRHRASDIMILRDVGIGNPMFFMWAAKYPKERSLESMVANWLARQLQASEQSSEVSFPTEDGWTIFGNLRIRQPNGKSRVPGAVLVHSNLSDRHIFDQLERKLASAGFAVLNIDFRGCGKSRGKGSYFDLPAAERDRAYLDVQAAMDFLSSQEGADANQLAIVATSVGVQYALRAASSDSRIKSFVVLGGLPARSEVEKASFPLMFVANQGVPQIAEAFEESYRAAKNPQSQLLKYEGGAVGYQLFQIDDKLESMIVTWLKSQSTRSLSSSL
ncbi:MAG TPA: alpha/beta fold hydrolase [Pyrinomonadaceae bacterium]|nr:alpha/beta fold hydrolase [Pyrinomonadaceae bacterium]